MRRIVIAPAVEGKGRSFEAICLATVEADALWSGGSAVTDDTRPVWAMFAGSSTEMRPFMANLVTGRKAEFIKSDSSWSRRKKGERLELLKSAGYQVTWQREVEGDIASTFLPDLFNMDPGMVDPRQVQFVLLPTAAWASEQRIDLAPIVQHVTPMGYPLGQEALASMVPISFLFATYLDRRVRCPLVSDGRFYLQFLCACLDVGFASWSGADKYSYREREWGKHSNFGFFEQGTEDVGLLPGIAFKSSHEGIEKLLAEQVAVYFKTRGI